MRNTKKSPGPSKEARDRWAQDSARGKIFTEEIRKLFGPEYYGSVDSLATAPFMVIESGSMDIGVGTGRTEEEAIKYAKGELRRMYPQILFPYMEDEINAPPEV